jgi:cold shock CspA family protein
MAQSPARLGTVVSFDARRGIGEVEDARTGVRYPFHCARIVDGSRTVPVGADVAFEVVPGPSGRWQASSISLTRS